jgi:hypothetical protein
MAAHLRPREECSVTVSYAIGGGFQSHTGTEIRQLTLCRDGIRQAGSRGRPRRVRIRLDDSIRCWSQPSWARPLNHASRTVLDQNRFLPITTGLGISPALIHVRSVRVVTCRYCAISWWSIRSSIGFSGVPATRSEAPVFIPLPPGRDQAPSRIHRKFAVSP